MDYKYKSKYIKYKTKYLDLKKQQGGMSFLGKSKSESKPVPAPKLTFDSIEEDKFYILYYNVNDNFKDNFKDTELCNKTNCDLGLNKVQDNNNEALSFSLDNIKRKFKSFEIINMNNIDNIKIIKYNRLNKDIIAENNKIKQLLIENQTQPENIVFSLRDNKYELNLGQQVEEEKSKNNNNCDKINKCLYSIVLNKKKWLTDIIKDNNINNNYNRAIIFIKNKNDNEYRYNLLLVFKFD